MIASVFLLFHCGIISSGFQRENQIADFSLFYDHFPFQSLGSVCSASGFLFCFCFFSNESWMFYHGRCSDSNLSSFVTLLLIEFRTLHICSCTRFCQLMCLWIERLVIWVLLNGVLDFGMQCGLSNVPFCRSRRSSIICHDGDNGLFYHCQQKWHPYLRSWSWICC